MKLAIVGSRSFSNYPALCAAASSLNPSEIVSGGASGADSLAVDFAADRGLEITEFKPDLDKFGSPAAFHIRNRQIAKEADVILACVGGAVSRGTASTIKAAKNLGKKVIII